MAEAQWEPRQHLEEAKVPTVLAEVNLCKHPVETHHLDRVKTPWICQPIGTQIEAVHSIAESCCI
jgi:hypothetical protein